VSAISSYFYDVAIRRYVLQYVFKKEDRSVLEAAAKELPAMLAHFERGYAQAFLAGPAPTLPDYFLAPIVGYLEMFPESKAALADCPKLMRAHAAMKERASWKATQP
jgi:glutathione S-transferase